MTTEGTSESSERSSPRSAVLLVDDDADIREAIHFALDDEGYEVAEACDGQEALDYLRSHPAPRAILLDWNMAGMNGPEFMIEVSKNASLAKVPVIVVTADTRAPDKLLAGYKARYLTKPFQLDTLFEMLRHCSA
jgi:CheY-like chemotaxis protein